MEKDIARGEFLGVDYKEGRGKGELLERAKENASRVPHSLKSLDTQRGTDSHEGEILGDSIRSQKIRFLWPRSFEVFYFVVFPSIWCGRPVGYP